MTVAARALRVLVGALLAWPLIVAVVAPEVPRAAIAGAILIAAATLWSAPAGLVLTAALAPAAALLAAPPVRAAELFAWSFLSTGLLSVWRPVWPARLPRTVTLPTVLYGAACVASWLMLTLSNAPGISPFALPQFLLHSIPADYLVFSSPEPEMWTLLQTTTGIALLVASMATIAPHPRLVRVLAWGLIGSVGLLAAATLGDVARQWAGMNYEGWFLLRYVRGERFSLHLADLNAAGSLYVLGGIVAAAVAALDARRRPLAIAILAVIAPAFWLTGSRTSLVAALAGVLMIAVAQQRWPLTRSQVIAACAFILVLASIAASLVDWQSDTQGSAARAAALRMEFMQTSTRMFAAAPVFGVGVGKYFDRSAEFMSADLRAIYGNENAHNYFVQQFAELGLVGGALFLWLACSLIAAGWRAARTTADPAMIGSFAAVSAYLVTCLTGHPLLVPEAALPLWIAAGSLAGPTEHGERRWTAAYRAAVVAACVLLAVGISRSALAYSGATSAPQEHGFHLPESGPDGTTFRWMTRHAVTYVPAEMGFVRLRLSAPDYFSITRPLVVETAIGGRVVDRRELPAGQWVSFDLPSRRPGATPFQRVDLRTNQWWVQEIKLGNRLAGRPVSVRVADIQWIPLTGAR